MPAVAAMTRRLALVGVLSMAVAALLWAGPPAKGVPGAGAGSAEWTAQPADLQLAALAALGGWLLVGWLALAALATAVSGLPGIFGVSGRVLSHRIAPAVVRRLVDAALGIALTASVATPTAALAAGPSAARAPAIERVVLAVAADAPAQLGDRVSTMSVSYAPAADQSPLDFDRPGMGPPALRPPAPAAEKPARRPAVMSVVRGARRADAAGEDNSIVVRRGDSLWSIAERELGALATSSQIDARWRAWYAANRSAIGRDPDVISPGSRLVPPAS